MFNHSKYTAWYFDIINRSKNRILETYTEKHHIVPKSLGGSDQPENLVSLTPREHFLVHWLLTKMVLPKHRPKMQYALRMMQNKSRCNKERILTSWQYTIARKALKRQPEEIRVKLKNKSKLGQKDSLETRLKKSIATTRYYEIKRAQSQVL